MSAKYESILKMIDRFVNYYQLARAEMPKKITLSVSAYRIVSEGDIRVQKRKDGVYYRNVLLSTN